MPGALGRVSSIIGDAGGNIVEVAHQRLFSDVSIKSAMLEFRGQGHEIESTPMRSSPLWIAVASPPRCWADRP